MSLLKELYSVMEDHDPMASMRAEAKRMGNKLHSIGGGWPEDASIKADKLMDIVDRHIRDGDVERADAYLNQIQVLLDKHQVTESDCYDCEIVYVDENDDVITEAQRAYKRRGKEIRKMYRCTSGQKKGKVVSDPKVCVQRKDPKKKRQGKKVMREKKGVIKRKTKISKRQAMSKLVKRMNLRISGKKLRI